MNRVFLMMAAMVIAVLAAAQENLCYEYPADSYRIVNERVEKVIDPKTHKTVYRDIKETLEKGRYRLLMAVEKDPGRLHVHRFFLVGGKSGKVLDSNTWTCPDPSLKPKRYYCYGECDGGIISIERDGSVNFKTEAIGIGETIDAPEGTWDIFPAKEADLPAPAPVPCQREIASMQLDGNADNETYIKDEIKHLVKPVLHVCYSGRELSKDGNKSVYHGCRFTRDSCDNYHPGWKTYGKYRSEKEAMEAYRECRGSAKSRR